MTEYRFPSGICNGCGMLTGDAYPSGHLVPSPILGLANAPIVETKFLELAMSLLDFSPRIPLGTFSILLQEYVSNWITHPVFYGDMVYKLKMVKDKTNFISSGSKMVKHLRRRQYDPSRGLRSWAWPFYRSFIKRCTLANKAVGTLWRVLSKPPQRRQGPDPRPLWLLVGTPSAFGPEPAYRLQVA